MSHTSDSTGITPPAGKTSKRNTKKVAAATIAIIATLAASGAAVAVNLGASEPPLDPAAGQLTANPSAASAQRLTTEQSPVDPTATDGTSAKPGDAPATNSIPGNCDDNDDRGDHDRDDDCIKTGEHDDHHHDGDHDDDHHHDDHHHEGADDDD